MAIAQAIHRWISVSALVFSVSSLVACGGGGSSSPTKGSSASIAPSSVGVSSAEPVISSSHISSVIASSRGVDFSSQASSIIGSVSSVDMGGNARSSIGLSFSSMSVLSSSSSESSIAADTTPAAFSFAPVEGAAYCDFITSESITVRDISQAVGISITGGEYAIDQGNYTAARGLVNAGQKVTVRIKCSAQGGVATTARLTIGDISAVFSGAPVIDAIPSAISFLPQDNAKPNTHYESNSVTLSDVNVPIAIHIAQGEYALDDGEFTAAAGRVNAGQRITLRALSSVLASTSSSHSDVVATLTFGEGEASVSADYRITTVVDNTPPTAQFMFPPPASMTEGEDIYARIKLTDDYSKLATISYVLNDEEPVVIDLEAAEINQQEDGAWLLAHTFPLVQAQDNRIRIIATDAAGNEIATEQQPSVMVRQDSTAGNFPNANMPLNEPSNMVFDNLNGRNRLIVNSPYTTPRKIYQVDLATGERSVYWDVSSPMTNIFGMQVIQENDQNILVIRSGLYMAKLELDGANLIGGVDGIKKIYVNHNGSGRKFVVDYTALGEMFYVLTTTGNSLDRSLKYLSGDFSVFNVFSDNTDSSLGPALFDSGGIVLDGPNNRYLTSEILGKTIIAINKDTRERTVLSSEEVGGGAPFEKFSNELAFDYSRNRILLNSGEENEQFGKILSVHPVTGERVVFSDANVPNALNLFRWNDGMVFHSEDTYAFVSDPLKNSILAVDMETGYRVYITKN